MADIFGTEDPDILDGLDGITDFSDRIYGLGGADEIYGLGGRDLIDGGAGGDYLDGGDGVDIADYSASPTLVAVNLFSGGVGGDANGDIYVSIEDIIGSKFDDLLTGDGNGNFINGIEGNNTIQGLGGNDVLNAYQGNDNMYGGDGNDRIFSSNGNDSLDGGAGDDDLSGTVGIDILTGGDGDDTLDGGEDADTLDGGAGTDTATYGFGAATGLTINLVAGTASDGDTLTGIENVIGGGFADTIVGDINSNKLEGATGNDVLNGNAGADVLNGGVGDDIVIGLTGGDQMDGGDGTDRAYYTSSNAGVTINLQLGTASGGHADGDTLTNIEGLVGSAFNDLLNGTEAAANRLSGGGGIDTITGLGGDDFLEGGDGNDLLIGGLGADLLRGDAGVDGADYAASNAAVTTNLVAGTGAGGHAQGDSFFSIEDVLGSAFADALLGDANENKLLGRAGNDLLSGNSGNDVLTGGAGADEVYGGAGIDTADYTGSNAAVQVNLLASFASGGHAAGDIIALIENATGSDFNDTLAGDGFVNVLAGAAGNDSLIGGGGGDKLDGGDGSDIANYANSAAAVQINLTAGTAGGGDALGDTLTAIENITASAFNDTIAGNKSANTLIGRSGNDVLTGSFGDDRLFGDDGNDVLTGGTEHDLLTGGLGSDLFDFNATAESQATSARDVIYDFTVDPVASAAFFDRIDVAAIDARAGVADDQAFSFIGAGAFTAEGQIRAFQMGANTMVQFHTTGAGGAEMEILLLNFTATSLSGADFVL